MLAEYFMNNEARKQEWKHIMLQVGKRTRVSKGKACNETVAINMQNDLTEQWRPTIESRPDISAIASEGSSR